VIWISHSQRRRVILCRSPFSHPEKIHDICDDCESAFYVLTWIALCYAFHDKTHPDHLGEYLATYDYSYPGSKYAKGAELKMLSLIQGILSNEVTFNAPFNGLVGDLTAHLRASYVKIEVNDLENLALLTQTITELEQAPDGAKAQLDMAQRFRDGNRAYNASISLQRL